MMLRHLTAAELAAELGRSVDWLYDNWGRLVAEKRLPPPVSGADGGALAWSAAQVYAMLDRDLPPRIQAAAAAYRAAAAAYVTTHIDPSDARAQAASRARLDRRLQKEDV